MSNGDVATQERYIDCCVRFRGNGRQRPHGLHAWRAIERTWSGEDSTRSTFVSFAFTRASFSNTSRTRTGDKTFSNRKSQGIFLLQLGRRAAPGWRPPAVGAGHSPVRSGGMAAGFDSITVVVSVQGISATTTILFGSRY